MSGSGSPPLVFVDDFFCFLLLAKLLFDDGEVPNASSSRRAPFLCVGDMTRCGFLTLLISAFVQCVCNVLRVEISFLKISPLPSFF